MPIHDATVFLAGDIDPIELLEDYLGIKLLAYQKEILRRILSNDKIYIYPWQSYERPSIRMINEIRKCYSLIIDDVSELKGEANEVHIEKEPDGDAKLPIFGGYF